MPEQGEEQEMVVVDFVVADDLTLANVADQSAPSASPKSKIRKQELRKLLVFIKSRKLGQMSKLAIKTSSSLASEFM